MLNLDTHILIKALQDLLSPKEKRALRNDPNWCVSAIVLWEIYKLHEIGRVNFGLDHAPLALALEQIEVMPVNYLVCRSLALLDFRSDPADEIIAATSLAYQIPLVTRDSRIRTSNKITFAV